MMKVTVSTTDKISAIDDLIEMGYKIISIDDGKLEKDWSITPVIYYYLFIMEKDGIQHIVQLNSADVNEKDIDRWGKVINGRSRNN